MASMSNFWSGERFDDLIIFFLVFLCYLKKAPLTVRQAVLGILFFTASWLFHADSI